jgi:hypothetical protein
MYSILEKRNVLKRGEVAAIETVHTGQVDVW